MIGGEAALAAIRAVFAEPVRYLPAGGGPAIDPLPVIWSDVAGAEFQGAGNTLRTITAEIERSTVPARPSKPVRIVRAGATWGVTEVVDRDDIDAWVVTLEQAV